MYIRTIRRLQNMSNTQNEIVVVCEQIKQLLLEKNRKYGDSAINPIRIFSKADTKEQIKVRIDDKLNRLKNLQEDETEDVITDLIGYLILLKIKMNEPVLTEKEVSSLVDNTAFSKL